MTKKIFLIIILVICIIGICPAHHGEEIILDKVVEQSIRNYNLSIECVNLINSI